MSLADSWVEARLNDVCLLNPKLAPNERPHKDIEITFIPMSAVDEVAGVIARPEIRNYSEVAKGYTSFKEGDVLFAKVTPCMENGKAAIVGPLLNAIGFGSTEFHVLRPIDGVLPEYLFHFIRQPLFRKYAASSFVGTGGLQRVPPDFLARLKLPLPTLVEQKRIVEILKQANAVSCFRDEAQEIINHLAKQRFTELFGHPAENPKGFDCFTLDQFGSLDRGISKHRPRDANHLFGGPYPFIQTGEVANAGDWITTHKSTYSEAGLAQSKLWPKGTLCITIAANIAKAAILDFDACFPDSVVGFTPFEGISSEYVLYCIRFYQEYFEHKAPKAAQMNINLETLRTLRIPNPPESLQLEFADFVKQVRLLSQATTEQLEKHNELLNELKIAAFSGELTAGWREINSKEIAAAVAERDELLHKKSTKPFKADELNNQTQPVTSKSVRAKTRDSASPQRLKQIDHGRPARHWLINELSEFQHAIWTMLRDEWRNLVIVDDPEAFNDFCTNPQTIWPIEHFNASPNRIRRTLEQLAALGLIAKVSVRRQNAATLQIEYLTAFRPLRDDENSRLRDAAMLKNALNGDGPAFGDSAE
ncbi:restriction endonuclease subunit S [Methylomonas sp. MED-D]|uniref:restriction endonuclease subunit S n=1 Tax=Methylomonas sp. MED-D TaxID=3418768 RepID=UPI003D0838B9